MADSPSSAMGIDAFPQCGGNGRFSEDRQKLTENRMWRILAENIRGKAVLNYKTNAA